MSGAFLTPLDALSAIHGLQIAVNLPNLHPRHEDARRHIVPGSTAAPFFIDRRLRQRVHGVNIGTNKLAVREAPDFPLLYEDSDEHDLEEVEETERRMWEHGEDVEAMVREQNARQRPRIHIDLDRLSQSSNDDDGDKSESDATSERGTRTPYWRQFLRS